MIFRVAPDDYLLTCAEPNLAYFSGLVGRHRVSLEDVSEASAVLSIQGPRSRDILGSLAPQVCDLPYFGLTEATIAGTPLTVSRTGYTGDLGYELWIPAEKAVAVWDAVSHAAEGQGVIPFGLIALYMARAASPGPTRIARRWSSSGSAGWSGTSPATTAPSSAARRSSASSARRARDGS